jgi:hypothetical protein
VADVILRLFPYGVVAGRVADADGEPLDDAGVRLFRTAIVAGETKWSL